MPRAALTFSSPRSIFGAHNSPSRMNTPATDSISAHARRYAKVIYWSDEDNCYIGALPEICGNCCHADTAEAVCSQLQDIAEDYVNDLRENAVPFSLPAPGQLHFCLSPTEGPRPLC